MNTLISYCRLHMLVGTDILWFLFLTCTNDIGLGHVGPSTTGKTMLTMKHYCRECGVNMESSDVIKVTCHYSSTNRIKRNHTHSIRFHITHHLVKVVSHHYFKPPEFSAYHILSCSYRPVGCTRIGKYDLKANFLAFGDHQIVVPT